MHEYGTQPGLSPKILDTESVGPGHVYCTCLSSTEVKVPIMTPTRKVSGIFIEFRHQVCLGSIHTGGHR